MTGFSRSVSSFPREFPKRAEEVRGRSSSATCPYDALCIYAQVDIGKSVQVGRLGTGSRDRGVFPARWEEFRDLNKCIGTSRHLDRQPWPIRNTYSVSCNRSFGNSYFFKDVFRECYNVCTKISHYWIL